MNKVFRQYLDLFNYFHIKPWDIPAGGEFVNFFQFPLDVTCRTSFCSTLRVSPKLFNTAAGNFSRPTANSVTR